MKIIKKAAAVLAAAAMLSSAAAVPALADTTTTETKTLSYSDVTLNAYTGKIEKKDSTTDKTSSLIKVTGTYAGTDANDYYKMFDNDVTTTARIGNNGDNNRAVFVDISKKSIEKIVIKNVQKAAVVGLANSLPAGTGTSDNPESFQLSYAKRVNNTSDAPYNADSLTITLTTEDYDSENSKVTYTLSGTDIAKYKYFVIHCNNGQTDVGELEFYYTETQTVKSATVFSSDDSTTWMLKEAEGSGTATVGSTTLSEANNTATGSTAELTSTSTDDSHDIIQIRPVVSNISLTKGVQYTLTVDYAADITALNSSTENAPVVYAALRSMYEDSSNENKETQDQTSNQKTGVKVSDSTGEKTGTITATVTPTVDNAYPEIQLYLRHCKGSVTFSNVKLTKTIAAGVEGSSENFGDKIGFKGDVKGADGTTAATEDEYKTVTEHGFAFINFENPSEKTGETTISDTAPGENGTTETVGNVTVGWANSTETLDKASYGTYVDKLEGATSAGFYAVPYIQTAEGTTWGDVTQAAWDSESK